MFRHVANTIFDEPVAALIQSKLNFPFIDSVISSVDFVGLNYYGKEVSSGTGIAIVSRERKRAIVCRESNCM